SQRQYPEVPTGVGFCMFVSRRIWRTIGGFDVETFGAGYGEENDFCQRAVAAGYTNLIADDAFVWHKGAGSFAGARDALIASNLAILDRRYPNYLRDVAAVVERHPLAAFHRHLAGCIAAGVRELPHGRRVLHVLHRGGGTEKHARELAA